MGNTIASIQQWSPQPSGGDKERDILDEIFDARPARIVMECPVAPDGTSQQLFRLEERDAAFLQQVLDVFEETRESLRFQWFPRAQKREKDVLIVVVYPYCSTGVSDQSAKRHRKKFFTLRVGPRSLQLISSSVSNAVGKKEEEAEDAENDDTISVVVGGGGEGEGESWWSKTFADLGQYDRLWRFETEENSAWPLHAILLHRLQTARETQSVPLTINKIQTNERTMCLSASEDDLRGQAEQTQEHRQTTQKIEWRLILQPKQGCEQQASELRASIAQLVEKLLPTEKHSFAGASASDDENEHVNGEENDAESDENDEEREKNGENSKENDENNNAAVLQRRIERLQRHLGDCLDFDDPWKQAGAIVVDETNSDCVAFVRKSILHELSAGKAKEYQVDEKELDEFVRRRIAQFKRRGDLFIIDSVRDCAGLFDQVTCSRVESGKNTHEDGKQHSENVYSDHSRTPTNPFHYDASPLRENPFLTQHSDLRDRALQKSSAQQADSMIALGNALITIVDEFRLENAIPAQMLRNAMQRMGCEYDGDETLLALIQLQKAGEWLVFWGTRGYGYLVCVS